MKSSLFRMDKDRGYAWVILGASTILMCVGPSTFTAYGFLLRDVSITLKTKSWILNVFYVCWLLSAFLVASFVKQRPRQLATTGAAVAAIGFLTSASMAKDASWLYLTFSLFVGFGLGLSFHTAYLVVMSNFDHYKGLANGVCQLCIAIGQITTPFLFTVVSLPKDRFQIKALTTAIGFLTTLFFVVPSSTPSQRRSTIVGDRNRRPSAVSRRSSQEGAPLHAGFIPAPSSNIPINSQGRPRRRSQYLLAVSTSLLPNIPEEPESTHSINDTLTSASSESEITDVQASNLVSQSVAAMPLDSDMWNELSPLNPTSLEDQNGTATTNDMTTSSNNGGSNDPSNMNQHLKLRRLSEGCVPAYVGKDAALASTEPSKNDNSSSATPKPNPTISTAPVKKPVIAQPRIRRYSESQLQSKKSPVVTIPTSASHGDFTTVNIKSSSQDSLQNSKKQQEAAKNSSSGGGSKKGESIIDLSLLKDYRFLNMASFSTLCTMTVVNYPIVLYFHILSKCEGCTKEADVALIIIYMVDLISRLLFSYLADLAAFSKRRSFHVASACAGVLIAATTVVDDISLLYCFCVVFGICVGLMVTSEYLMFIECFGYQRFNHAYGYVNLCKLVVLSVLGLIAIDPLSVYLYPIHPLDQDDSSRNSSAIYDPIDLGHPSLPDAPSPSRILLGLAVPSVLCTLAWLTEDIYRVAFRRCRIPAPEKAEARAMAIP